MIDVMLFGVLKMPYEMAMASELSRIQFYQRVQELVARFEEQPEQQPVAWGFRHHDGAIYDCISPEAHADCEGEYNVPLYDAPPKRKPLTNEQIVVILKDPNIAEKHQRNWLVLPYAYARAIEDAHGIKE